MTRHVVGLAVTLFVLGFSTAVAEGSGRPTRIVNPYKAEHFSCKGRPDGRLHNHPYERFGYNGFRIATDLNFDGREDMILSKGADTHDGSGGCGNAGCAVTVFLMRIDKSYSSVDFFLHPFAVGSKKITRGGGRLVIYQRGGAEDGTLESYEVGANSIELIKSVQLHGSELSEYTRAISVDASALHVEYSYCVAGKLQWRDSYE